MSPSDLTERLRVTRATSADLAAIIALLADDPIGQTREIVSDPIDVAYLDAFDAIERDPNQQLLVARQGGRVVGCLQLAFVPGISRRGMWRGQIEGVRVANDARGHGVGRAMMEHAFAACRERGCGLIQLTTDKTRPDAIRFYEALGFTATHEGMKRSL